VKDLLIKKPVPLQLPGGYSGQKKISSIKTLPCIRQMKKAILLLLIALGIVMTIQFLDPGTLKSPRRCKVKGLVTEVYQKGKNAVLKIAGRNGCFILHTTKELRERLLGKEIEIFYADDSTPLDPQLNKPVKEVLLKGEKIYHEEKK
jgi:hypothetical protein